MIILNYYLLLALAVVLNRPFIILITQPPRDSQQPANNCVKRLLPDLIAHYCRILLLYNLLNLRYVRYVEDRQ